MSFKNLEERFNANVNKLYAGATNKFANGRASTGRNDDPLIVRAPGKGYWTKLESRSTPVESGKNDVKRLTLFQLSPNGIQFLAKQQLLQTGNTFEFTRALNPAFVVGNGVPFLHVKRNLRPLTELVGKTDRGYANVKTMGQLQFSTYNSLKSKGIPAFYDREEPGAVNASRPNIAQSIGKRLLAPLNALKDTVLGTISAFNPLQKRNVGEIRDKWGKESWLLSRPELIDYSKGIQKIIAQNQKNGSNDVTSGIALNFTPTTNRYSDRNNPTAVQTKENVIKFIKYFDPGQSLASVGPGTDKPNSVKAKRGVNGGNLVNPLSKNQGKISYIKDPLNTELPTKTNHELQPYNKLLSPDAAAVKGISDIITVSFAMGKNNHIQFRAFVKDLQQNATPEYKFYQYIGRVEKFINYTGVQREISFKLGIIAFSQDELDIVWKRINYITSFVYPYGFNRGIMQPNIIRLTIGDVYKDQPGYVTSLGTNFSGITDTWEIARGKQVPISAEMDIKFTLIEKYTKIASSPFYGITEAPGSGFVQPIEIPKTTQQPSNSRQEPSNQTPTQVNVDRRTSNTEEDSATSTRRSSRGLPNFIPSNTFSNTEEALARGLGGIG